MNKELPMPDDIVSLAEHVRSRRDFSRFVPEIDGGWPGNVPSLLHAIAAAIPEVVRVDPSAANERVPWVVFARVIAKALSEKTYMAVPETDERPEPISDEDQAAMYDALSEANSPHGCAHAIELIAKSYSRDWANPGLVEYASTAALGVVIVGDSEIVFVPDGKGNDFTRVAGPLVKDPDMPPWRILAEVFFMATTYE